ncbi:helix-turn-helix domain-containing protein [Porcipelethomonas sp.]|uniref:AraC family transcriptional regulator n=1 Tax=Porcipelethomonas sp. TaxID=2981675 RepID=UPI003EF41FA3
MEQFMLSQKENKEHSTQLVPYSYYRSDIPDGMPDVALHWHTEMEINFIREGKGCYQVGEEHAVCEAGDIVIIPPNILHSVYPAENMKVSTDTLVFNMDFIGASVPDRASVSYIRPVMNGSAVVNAFINKSGCGYGEYSACLDNAFEYLKKRPDYFELGLKSELIKFIYLLFSNKDAEIKSRDSRSRHNADKIKKALLYIQENYRNEITVSQLAEMCHFSEQYFISFFKKAVGISCVSYINQFRLKTAAEMLKTTEMSVSETAFECGFRNLSNFNRQFKEYFKVTPKEFRKQT